MTQRYTPHDLSLVSTGLIMRIAPGNAGTGGSTILFQFPPKVKNDGRGGSWKENATGPTAGDLLAIYEHAKARQISMEWTYIVDGGTWTVSRIQEQLVQLRKYFVNSGGSGLSSLGTFGSLAVHLLIWGMGGPSPMSFRFESVNIKHGDTLVGSGANAFPLRSDVSAELRSWPKIALGTNCADVEPVQIAPGQICTPAAWY